VANSLEIDSVRPSTVKFGEKLRVYGVGTGQLSRADLGGTPLIVDTASLQGDRQLLGSIQFWVPPPAQTAQLVGIGLGFSRSPEIIVVDTVDLYEPNDTAPSFISLDGPPQIPSLGVLFFNPALALEPVSRADLSGGRQDWYHFQRSDTTQALTLVFRADAGSFPYFSDTLLFCDAANAGRPECGGGTGFFVDPAEQTWVMGPFRQICNNVFFGYSELPSDSSVLALKTLPSRTIQLLAFYNQPGRSSVTVLQGYRTSDPRIGPDRFEENDLWCKYADANYARIPIDIARGGGSFSDTLTIDNPHDLDWYKFHLLGGAADSVTISMISRPFPGDIDRTDIDLYLLDSATFNVQGFSFFPGSTESFTLLLNPGAYYLLAQDWAGVATRYSLCITVGGACTLVPGSRPSGVAPPRQRKNMTLPSFAAPFAGRRLPFRRP
jgi:hypothetical protein